MESRDEALSDALHRIDPALAGLFRRGLALSDELGEPGVAYLVGHAGRELSNAVVRLARLEASPSEPRTTQPKSASMRRELAQLLRLELTDERLDRVMDLVGDGHRAVVGQALALGADHPFVAAWLRTHRDLVAITHFRHGGRRPDPDRVRASFRDLARLLYYRLAPYFDTEEELDQLISLPEPSADDLELTQRLLVRPRLRFRFFTMLNQAAWLEPLSAAGVFDHPPEWIELADGGKRLVPWPEGECLVRLAPQAPELVARSLAAISPTLRNPSVWDIVARAVLNLPPEKSRPVVSTLTTAVMKSSFRGFRHNQVDAAVHLAKSGEASSFGLTEALLGLQALPRPTDENPWMRHSSELLLERLDRYEFEQFIEAVVDPLLQLDPAKTWDLLFVRLERALSVARKSGYDDDHMSQHWCDLRAARARSEDVRAVLARECARCGAFLLRLEPERADDLLRSLDESEVDLVRRVGLKVLAGVGDAHPDWVSKVVEDKESLDPSFGSSEVAEVLRRWFSMASERSQASFLRHLTEGPDPEEIAAFAEFRGEDPASDSVAREILAAWQRRRLRWFHDSIPPALEELASELGVAGTVPSVQQQDLDEVGFHHGGVSWRGDASPVEAEELRAMSPTEMLTYLLEWEPAEMTLDGPTSEGLMDTLQAVVAADPTELHDFLSHAASTAALNPRYRSAILDGLKQAARNGHDLPWGQALAFSRHTVELADAQLPTPPAPWRWARNSAIDLISTATTESLLTDEHRGEALRFAHLVVAGSPGWSPSDEGEPARFGDIVHGILNWEAGKAAYLLLCVALWLYREDPSGWEEAYGAPVRDMLDGCILRSDPGRIAVRARLGEFLPQLLLICPQWVEEVQADLFSSGAIRPLQEPALAAYLVLSSWNSRAFEFMRPWLVQHVSDLPGVRSVEDRGEDGVGDWSIAKHFLVRVASAYLHGHIKPADEDGLMRLTFEASRPSDRGHFYWQIYRGWSDSSEEAEESYVVRVCELWRWRLSARNPSEVGQADEDDGFLWFFLTPHLPTDEVLELGEASFGLSSGEKGIKGMVWPRLAELSQVDTAAVIRIAEGVIRSELSGGWPHFDTKELRPVLAAGLAAEDRDTRERTTWLINDLGDRGWGDFGELLR